MARFVSEHTADMEWSIGADLIYDYFSTLFKKEVANDYIHNIWLSAEYAIDKCDTDDQKKIIKALAIILIVKNEDELPATDKNLRLSVNAVDASQAIDELVQKNVELELQLESIRKALIEATEDSSGVEQLKQEALAGYDIFKASVINNSVTHADNYITLDKGEADGIRSEMGVVNGSGVVGIVYLTSPHYSIVIPVLNSKSSISCKIKRSDYFGFLKWDGGSSEFAFIKDMPRHSLFSLGDTIVTSGHSAVFPSGIPVGTIDDIADSHDGLSYLLRVKLFTDFARLNDVRVIAQKGQEEQLELEKQVKTTK